jgi:hypothetical protein
VFLMTRPELDWFYGGGAGAFLARTCGSASSPPSPRGSATT